MKIYGSTEYIKSPNIGDLKLNVNSMWDFGSRNICYNIIPKTFGTGETTIFYNLRECIKSEDSFVIGSNPPEPCKSTQWKDAEITEEILKCLKEKNYIISSEYESLLSGN